MILDADNTITLAVGNDRLVLDRSDRPAPSRDAVLALLPAWVRASSSDVRDAILDALSTQMNLSWARIGQVLAQLASPRHAAGTWLRAWGELLHRPAVAGEDDGAYRARLLAAPDVVTPDAIRRAVEALVEPVTITDAVLMEPAVDGMFAAPATGATWACFAQPAAARLWGDDPARPGATWGAYLVPDARALFWVILPFATDEGEPIAFCEVAPGSDAGDSFVAPSAEAYAFAFAVGDSLLERVVSSVEPRRGGGVAWMAFNDSLLSAAV